MLGSQHVGSLLTCISFVGSLKSAPAEAGTRTKAPTVLAAGPGELPGAVISPWKPLRVFWLMAATLVECKEGDPLGECDFTVPCPGCEGNQPRQCL